MVNCKFGWMLLNSCSVRSVLISFSLYIINFSSSYLKLLIILCLARVLYILSPFIGVTNKNGVWIGFTHHSFTITRNHNI
jgi:hypothetical protein